MSTPLIIFTHIPRAGGTSMWQAFRAVYGRRVCRVSGKGPAGTRQKIAELLRNHAMDYDVLGGHVRYGIGENCSRRPCQYFTVLRDPTSMILSLYYKNQLPEIQDRKAKMRPGDFHETRKELQRRFSVTPEEFLQKRNNVLIRYLWGMEKPRNVTRTHLDAAKEHLLSNYVCFGLVERYAESMELIARSLGWESAPQVESRNKGGNRPQKYDTKLFELGREVNALDYELYEFAQKLFDEKSKINTKL